MCCGGCRALGAASRPVAAPGAASGRMVLLAWGRGGQAVPMQLLESPGTTALAWPGSGDCRAVARHPSASHRRTQRTGHGSRQCWWCWRGGAARWPAGGQNLAQARGSLQHRAYTHLVAAPAQPSTHVGEAQTGVAGSVTGAGMWGETIEGGAKRRSENDGDRRRVHPPDTPDSTSVQRRRHKQIKGSCAYFMYV